MDFKGMDLFQALEKGVVSDEGGYITTSHFAPNSIYSIFKTIKFKNIKGMSFDEEEVNFNTDGRIMHLMFEPKSYLHKHIEPSHRKNEESIPYRFSECSTIMTNRNDKVHIGTIPKLSYKTFTVSRPQDQNFAYYFPFGKDDVKTVLEVYKKIFLGDFHMTTEKTKKINIIMNGVIKRFDEI